MRLTVPSSRVIEPDLRRQARLLSSVLVILIPLIMLSEVATLVTFSGHAEPYRGYIITIAAVAALAVAYVLSRSAQHMWGALLTSVAASVTVFAYAAQVPEAVPGGMLDYLLIPLLLASAFLPIRQFVLFSLGNLVALILFPLFVTEESFGGIIVGSVSFFVLASGIVVVLTRHRDQLEHDRSASIREAELRARREAARTAALLRVASRLNALMDLETVLVTMCEETARVLAADSAIAFIYDDARGELSLAASDGLPLGTVLPSAISLSAHNRLEEFHRTSAALAIGSESRGSPEAAELGLPRVVSSDYATLSYGGRLVGSLLVMSHTPEQLNSEDQRLLLRGLADQSALAIVNTRLYKDARQRLERLQALRTIDIAITDNRDIQTTLEVLLEQITHQLGVDAALVLLLDTGEQRLVYGAGRGFRTQALRATRLRVGDGRAGQAALQRRIIAVTDLETDMGGFMHAPLLGHEGFVSYFAAPLVAKDEVRGVLEIFHRAPLTPNPEWLDFLEALAGQAAIAIDNTTLLSDLLVSNNELAMAYDATILGWSHALDLRDQETEGHTQRVTQMTLDLARWLGRFSEQELVHVRRGALLHDIGKMGVPDSILLKPGPLSDEEWVVMRRHPVLALEMLRPIEYLRPALDIPYSHHEKWDGTGYPSGLKGEQIPLAARMFAIVDIWDALRSHRPYRAAWPDDKVRAHLDSLAGNHLDAQLVAAFLEMTAPTVEEGALGELSQV